MIPEWIRRRQRLRVSDVKNGVADVPGIEGAEQVLLHELWTTAHLHKFRTARQTCQCVLVEKSCCFSCEWQQTHQNIAVREKIWQLVSTAETCRTFNGMQ